MMKIMLKSAIAVVLSIIPLAMNAQTGIESGTKFGKGQDSIDCVRALSLYQSDYKAKNYESALPNWRHVWNNCPKASVNLGVPHGTTIYKYMIAKELNPTKQAALVDTLMMIYRRTIELRPTKKGEFTIQMAQDMVKYTEDNPDKTAVLKLLSDCIFNQKDDAPAIIYASYMNILLKQNVEGSLSDEDLLETYTLVSDKLNAAIKTSQNEELAKVRDLIDDNFAKSTAASCENMIKIYSLKFDENKEDSEFLRKLTNMLNKKECTDSELFEKASEQLYALNPSADAAYNMARMFLKKDDIAKAIEYYQDAIKSETDPISKANYLYQLGGIMLSKRSSYSEAKRLAQQAISLRPDWGAPYALLANTYAGGPKVGENAFENAYVYWVVVDKLLKAKAVDPEYAARANVNTLIAQYSQHFPKKEEAFFYNITEGTTVTVGGWIGETTKVRFIN